MSTQKKAAGPIIDRVGEGLIVVRGLGKLIPKDWYPGAHQVVEYYPPDPCSCPYGQAWVFLSPVLQIIEYMQVRDDCRGQGIATELVKFCWKRWPKMTMTDAISPSGEALVAKLERLGLYR